MLKMAKRAISDNGSRSATRVCLVTPEFPPIQWGGLSRTAENVAVHLSRAGLQVHVAHMQVEDDPVVLLDENRKTESGADAVIHRFRIGREPVARLGASLWDCPHNLTLQMMYQSLEKLHLEIDFHIFHSFFLYPVGYVTGLLAHRYGRRHVASIVGNDIKRYPFSPEKAFLCANALSNSDRVVAVSRDLVDLADALRPVKDRSRVIYNSVSIPSRAWKPHGLKGRFRVGFAGIFKYAKGVPYLMKATADLAKSGPAHLELLGHVRDSEAPVLDEMIRRAGVEGSFSLRSPVGHKMIFRWLRGLDVFALSSVTEGCPNILMEAMASGLPVVATKVGAVPDLVEDRKSGLLVPWGDAAALSSALAEIRSDPGLGVSLGRAARVRMKFFSPARERKEWESLYGEILSL